MSPNPALYNSAKLCKPLRYMECKRNKCSCEEGVGGGRFQRRKVRIACLLVLREKKLKVNGIITGVREMERAREGGAILLNDVWHSGDRLRTCWF